MEVALKTEAALLEKLIELRRRRTPQELPFFVRISTID